LNQGNFLWNGGMFVWKCSTVIKLTKEYLVNTYEVLSEIAATSESEFNQVLENMYPQVDSVSVDYGIMEKAKNIYVIPSDFGWDDIGTWYSVERYRDKDDNNNVCVGDIKNIDGCNNIVVSKEKPIVVVGLDDVFVVESDEIIFVGKKEDIERIKEIKKRVV
jgi:mannose-1-phosphate guanylyltransferase